MSEEGCEMLVQACPNLKKLALYGRNELILISLDCAAILADLPQLEEITLYYCFPAMTNTYWNVLLNKNPSLKIDIQEGSFTLSDNDDMDDDDDVDDNDDD